jgi:DNA (cytosine-5)-methyltransferase 1
MVALSGEHFKSGRFDFPTNIALEPKTLEGFIDFDGDVPDEYYLPNENRYSDMIMKQVDDRRSIYQLRKYFVRSKMPNVLSHFGLGGHNVPFIVGKKGFANLPYLSVFVCRGSPKGFTFRRPFLAGSNIIRSGTR